jgi:diguanylate cyclase (GGDEF)-like protein
MAGPSSERAFTDAGVSELVREIRDWQVWKLAEPLRSYILAAPALSLAAIIVAAVGTQWQARQVVIFLALLACGAASIEATRGMKEPQGTAVRDLQSVWYLSIAIILPSVYAFLAPILLMAYKLFRVRRNIVYRRVFSNAVISLAYGCVSIIFHAVPYRIAGSVPGVGNHVLQWTAVVACCALIGRFINGFGLSLAIKLADPLARFREVFGSRESLTSDAIEISLAVFITLVVAISPVMMVLALPTVIMQRRYLVRMQLAAQARLDAETGLLNAGTWQREAEVEMLRAVRGHTPLALAMVVIDHFKDMNETAGQAVRDELFRDIAGIIRDQLPGVDLIGRYGGEEFAILLPQTDREEARRISERLRDHIAGEPIAIESGTHAGYVFRLTVSIGVAVMNESRRALTELVGAADSALDQATRTGWSKVYVLPDAAAGQDDF